MPKYLKSDWNSAHSIFFAKLYSCSGILKNIHWAEFLSDFKNVGTKIFKKINNFQKKYLKKFKVG